MKKLLNGQEKIPWQSRKEWFIHVSKSKKWMYSHILDVVFIIVDNINYQHMLLFNRSLRAIRAWRDGEGL